MGQIWVSRYFGGAQWISYLEFLGIIWPWERVGVDGEGVVDAYFRCFASSSV